MKYMQILIKIVKVSQVGFLVENISQLRSN